MLLTSLRFFTWEEWSFVLWYYVPGLL
jgi:hypothetical protein